jgi:hypothetical protein
MLERVVKFVKVVEWLQLMMTFQRVRRWVLQD